MSNGALVRLKNIVRNGFLWSNIVFVKEVTSHSNIKRLQAWSFLVIIWMHTNCATRVFFLLLFSCNFDIDQLSLNFHRFVIMLGYTKWEYWSLTITKVVQYPDQGQTFQIFPNTQTKIKVLFFTLMSWADNLLLSWADNL